MRKLLTLLSMIVTLSLTAAPKYVFYFIGDGMGLGHVMSANWYNKTVLNQGNLLMTEFPAMGTVTTYSASRPITDSAAAGTALSTGHKTRNGMLGMDKDSVKVTPISITLRDMGYGIGVVTSVAPDDATPAAFYASVPARSMFYEIGKDAAASGFDFIAGSSWRGAKDTDLLQEMQQNNVTVATGLDELRQAKTRKVVLLSPENENENDIGYTVDSIEGALTLPVMTQECLQHLLKNSPDKFFMMVEGGNIDHAAHSNDAGTVVKEIVAFQDAIRVAYDFYLAHPDETLIVVTADHDTGGMTLGQASLHYDAHLEYLKPQQISKDQFAGFCKGILKSRANYAWEDMRQKLEEEFGLWTIVPVTEKQETTLKEAFEETFKGRNEMTQETLYGNYYHFVATVFRVIDEIAGIGWTTTSHTGNLVPIFAIGSSSDSFSHFIDNTQIPGLILEAK